MGTCRVSVRATCKASENSFLKPVYEPTLTYTLLNSPMPAADGPSYTTCRLMGMEEVADGFPTLNGGVLDIKGKIPLAAELSADVPSSLA